MKHIALVLMVVMLAGVASAADWGKISVQRLPGGVSVSVYDTPSPFAQFGLVGYRVSILQADYSQPKFFIPVNGMPQPMKADGVYVMGYAGVFPCVSEGARVYVVPVYTLKDVPVLASE